MLMNKKNLIIILLFTLVALLMFNMAGCNEQEENQKNANKNDDLELVRTLLSQEYEQKKEDDLQRVKKVIGTWRVEKYLFGPRIPVEIDGPDNELVGKELIIKEDLSLILNGEEYTPSKIENMNYALIAWIHNCVYGKVGAIGSEFISVGYVKTIDNHSANFGLYLPQKMPYSSNSIDENNYIWGGEGFRVDGMYELIRIE